MNEDTRRIVTNMDKLLLNVPMDQLLNQLDNAGVRYTLTANKNGGKGQLKYCARIYRQMRDDDQEWRTVKRYKYTDTNSMKYVLCKTISMWLRDEEHDYHMYREAHDGSVRISMRGNKGDE